MKIQQMVFMLMAVTLFFVLAGLFLLGFVFSGLKKSATSLEEENSLLLVTKLSNSPEFSCGNAFDNSGISCIDADKLIILTSNSERYNNFWGKGISNIEVVKILGFEKEIVCTKGNYPDCNVIRVFSSSKAEGYYNENFVSLCRKASTNEKTYDKCEVARLRVGYEGVK